MKTQTNQIVISILLGVMCCFLTAGILVQVRTVKKSITTVGKTQQENQLRDSVLRWKEKYDNTYEKIEKKDEELAKLREKATASVDSSQNLNNKLDDYNLLLGYSDLIGKGLIVTLKDGDDISAIVHAEDVLEIINALKNADAEAISVNGQRITSRTAICCVGNVITINDKKVGTPFVIKAIGPTYQLYSSVTMSGGYAKWLEDDGVKVDIDQKEKEEIIIPKYEGVYQFKYASNIE